MEQVLLDLGAGLRWLRGAGFERLVLLGNSGGGSLSALHQATTGPDTAADGMIALNAHRGRAQVLTDWLDPSVVDEADRDSADPSLDMFVPGNGPPYAADFVARYRRGQEARNRRITTWCEGELRWGRDRAFVVHRTTADPRMLDTSLDPSDREPGCYWGADVRAANYGAPGLGRWTSCRSWVSQWGLHTALGAVEPNLERVKVPLVFIQGTADQGIFPSDVQRMYDAATVADKQLHWIEGGTHYFAGQPRHQLQVWELIDNWLRERGLNP
jgi:pimeloyl-ACP methyl ester carboxylesterase